MKELEKIIKCNEIKVETISMVLCLITMYAPESLTVKKTDNSSPQNMVPDVSFMDILDCWGYVNKWVLDKTKSELFLEA